MVYVVPNFAWSWQWQEVKYKFTGVILEMVHDAALNAGHRGARYYRLCLPLVFIAEYRNNKGLKKNEAAIIA